MTAFIPELPTHGDEVRLKDGLLLGSTDRIALSGVCYEHMAKRKLLSRLFNIQYVGLILALYANGRRRKEKAKR